MEIVCSIALDNYLNTTEPTMKFYPIILLIFLSLKSYGQEEKTNAVFDSVNIDNKFYPENPTKTEMFCDDKITILIESDQLAQMRANLNSSIRLIQTSYDSIESVDI